MGEELDPQFIPAGVSPVPLPVGRTLKLAQKKEGLESRLLCACFPVSPKSTGSLLEAAVQERRHGSQRLLRTGYSVASCVFFSNEVSSLMG